MRYAVRYNLALVPESLKGNHGYGAIDSRSNLLKSEIAELKAPEGFIWIVVGWDNPSMDDWIDG